jgi:hypothetical protein
MSNLFHIPLVPLYKWIHIVVFNIRFCKEGKEDNKGRKMSLKLYTTISKIQHIPNSKNIETINEFLKYMRSNGSSEHHQNNN